jgi:SAM-dependent methyltransferase
MNIDLKKLYEKRFEGKIRQKNDIWKILCKNFFQKYIKQNDVVIDVGAGYCEFINNIRCAKKYAVDLNAETKDFAAPDVKVYHSPSTKLSSVIRCQPDIVFMSNLLEHHASKDDVLKTLSEIHKIMNIGGKLLILQPNIRYLYKHYWDFFDHHIPLSDKSLVEALASEGFSIEQILPKFLPYTTKSRVPKMPFLIKLYLKLPIIWKIFGRQMFIVAKKEETTSK